MNGSRRAWGLVVLFFFGWVLVYANRTVLSPLLHLLEGEWGFSRTGLGLVNSLFFLVYWLVQVPSGWLADRLGRKRLLVPSFALQGLGAAATGLAWGPGSLLAFRTLTGLGQGPYYSTQYALAAAAVPAERRGLALALINSGMAFGIALGYWTATRLTFGRGLDWRVSPLLLGVATLVLTVALAGLVREEGAASRAAGRPAGRVRLSRGEFSRLCLAAFLGMYGLYTALTWLPYYLQVTRGVDGVRAGALSLLLPAAAAPAGVLAGLGSDRLRSRLPVLRALFLPAGLALVALVLLPFPLGVVVGAVVYGLTGKLAADPLLVAFVADASPPEGYATAFALLNFASTAAMVAAPVLTGYVADLTGDFAIAFYVAAAFQGVAWALLGGLGRGARGRPAGHRIEGGQQLEVG